MNTDRTLIEKKEDKEGLRRRSYKARKVESDEIYWKGGTKTVNNQIEHEQYAENIYGNQKMFDNYEEHYKIAQENMMNVYTPNWKDKEGFVKFTDDKIMTIEDEITRRYQKYVDEHTSKIKRAGEITKSEQE